MSCTARLGVGRMTNLSANRLASGTVAVVSSWLACCCLAQSPRAIQQGLLSGLGAGVVQKLESYGYWKALCMNMHLEPGLQ